MRRLRATNYLSAGALIILSGVATGAMFSGRQSGPSQAQKASVSAPQPRIATVSGHMSGPWTLKPGTTDVVVVMLRHADWSTCEDLGRQLRDLRRATRLRKFPMYVLTDSANHSRLAVLLRRENIQPDHILVVDLEKQSLGLSRSTTPAALRLDPAGQVIVGIAHVETSPGYRRESFVQELELSTR